ncbi:MAG TPA: MFS transporter [Clostridiales bacterium]|nr:MFS transporter [Clostridiales bacterium]
MNESKRNANKIIALCWISYAISYVGRLNYSACMSEIMSDMAIESSFAGTISTVFLGAYGLGQLINGLLGDRISPKFMIFTGLFGAGIANILMGLAGKPALLLIFWCANGIFNSMLWSPVIRAFAIWLSKDYQKIAGLRIPSTIPAGKIASYLISSIGLHFLSWRLTFVLIGGILILFAFIWFVGIGTLRDYINSFTQSGKNATVANATTTPQKPKTMSLAKCILTTGLVFAVFNIFANGMIKDGVTQWVPTYLKTMFSVGSSTAAALTMVLPLVELLGAVVAYKILDKVENEFTTCAIMWTICLAAISILALIGKNNIFSAVGLVAVSTSTMLGVNNMILTVIPLKFAKVGRSASVTGFLNACSYLASAVSSLIFGLIAENYGWNNTVYSWCIIAVFGTLTAFMGINFWQKGKKRIEENL